MRKIAVLSMMLCLAAVSSAQTITGTITGTVSDASGAVVPNVKITATNEGTGVQTTATANRAGIYSLPFLPVGQYTVTAEGAGFKKSVLGPIPVEVNQVVRMDVSLQVGAVAETVEVTAVAPPLQTETTQTGQTLDSKRLTDLPLNGRNIVSAMLLIPGAVQTNPSSVNTASRFPDAPSSTAIASRPITSCSTVLMSTTRWTTASATRPAWTRCRKCK